MSPPAPAARQPADASASWNSTYLHARREAVFIFLVWLAALAWTIPYCYGTGYQTVDDPSATPLVWGMPTWVFGGIVCPWLVANVVTIVFCLGYFKLDPLEEDAEVSSAQAARQEGA
jgi:hypothetical protein